MALHDAEVASGSEQSSAHSDGVHDDRGIIGASGLPHPGSRRSMRSTAVESGSAEVSTGMRPPLQGLPPTGAGMLSHRSSRSRLERYEKRRKVSGWRVLLRELDLLSMLRYVVVQQAMLANSPTGGGLAGVAGSSSLQDIVQIRIVAHPGPTDHGAGMDMR